MKSHPVLYFMMALLGLGACLRPSGNEPRDQVPAVLFEESYRPPLFDDPDRLSKISLALSGSRHHYLEALEKHHLPGLAYGLVVDDSLVFCGGFGSSNTETGAEVSEHTLFRIASMTKSFTAMAILKLRDEGRLSLYDPVSRHLPELDRLVYLSGDAPPVSIFNLLTMTAGFPEDNPWGDRFLDMGDNELLEQVKKGISFSTVPSVDYEYSNLGYGLLGQIISRVSGVPYQEYITRNILDPLGMTHTLWEYEKAPEGILAQGYRWEDDRWQAEELLHDGAFGAMGGLITSISDFARYVSFHLSAWPPRSDPETGPVRRSTVREMHSMFQPRYFTDPDRFGEAGPPLIRAYGFGLAAMKDLDGIYEVGHNGGLPGFGSSYMFFPHHGIGIMAFGNLTYAGTGLRSANYRIIEELIRVDLFSTRSLPVSGILERRKEQVMQLLLSWDPELEKEIVAANLYLDMPREQRVRECREYLIQTGRITGSGPMIPENQLRGSFLLYGEKKKLRVTFTLSPEAEARVQWLSLEPVP